MLNVLHVTLATMMLAALLGAAGWSELTASGGTGEGGFEVWIADQSDTRPGHGGQVLVYEGAHLM